MELGFPLYAGGEEVFAEAGLGRMIVLMGQDEGKLASE
jgi:hypothetical protein